MAIAKIKTPETPAPVVRQTVVAPKVHNEVVDTRYNPRKSLLTYVTGMQWQVTYYSQILGDDSEPMPLQPEESGILQQYLKIRKAILKVQSDLQRNPATDEGVMEVTGVSILMPGIIPQYGDMFIADVGDGNAGLFSVTNVEQLSIYVDTAYQIEYGLTQYIDDTIEANINRKVDQDAVYDMDYVRTGKNPIIAASEFFTREKLMADEATMVDQYLNKYYDKEFATFTLPSQIMVTYDPAYTRFVAAMIDNPERPSGLRVVVYDETFGDYTSPVTLWDMLIKQEPRMFSYVSKVFTASPVLGTKGSYVLMGGLAYSMMDLGIYAAKEPTRCLVFGVDIKNPAPTIVNPKYPTEIHITPTYVLSEAFYDQDRPNMNELERQIHNLITNQPIDSNIVDQLTEEYYKASDLVQYYTFPLMLCLYRTAAYRVR